MNACLKRCVFNLDLNRETAGRSIQHRTLLLRSRAVVIAAVCGFALSC